MLPEHRAEHSSGFDLEDGEITDEAKLEDAGGAAMEADDAVEAASSAETGPKTPPVPSNPAFEDPRSSSIPAVVEETKPPASYPEARTQESETPASAPDPKAPSALSPEELDLAKNIVLDLLGWGVQPEYLVDCGVSSHAIYRIFTDLHLRLPSNLPYFG
ncbi:hypothetical protein FPV67DRAFT_1671299 [Lyophyllum atratum]|nr:hypothetical protein FPV67DRAFT_1671299 [Lyophyllum atratum]